MIAPSRLPSNTRSVSAPTPATPRSLLIREAGRWRRLALAGAARFGAGFGDHELAGSPAGSWLRIDLEGGRLVASGSAEARLGDGRRLDRGPLELSPHDVLRVGSVAMVLFAEQATPAGVATAPLLRAGDGVSGSPAVWSAWAELLLAARAPCPVLIQGETGTGKELAARLLHQASARSSGPLVAIAAGSLPRDTLHAELFGARRGAYTGCVADREGVFGQADGGTLLLDEIGELDAHAQASLLRVLETGEITPLGGKPRRVDVRLVAATHRDLQAMAATGAFRLDLLHRIAVACVELPPLRRRDDDAAALLATLLHQPLDSATSAMARRHPWPGNLRELRNVVQRLQIALDGAACVAADLRVALRLPEEDRRSDFAPSLPEPADRLAAVRAAMDVRGESSAAWRRSGLPRATYFRLARALRSEANS